jgi:tetratricopeptide (TPR) repeat protein
MDDAADESIRLMDVGNSFYDDGDFASALPLFVRAVDLGAEYCRINIGNTLRELGRIDDAVDAFRVGWNSGDRDIGWNLASVLRESGDIDAAAPIEDELFVAGYPLAVVNEAWNRHDAGEQADAMRLLRGVLADEGAAGDHAAGVLGMWMLQGGDSTGATEALLRRGMVAYLDARVELADLLIGRGDEVEAEQLLVEGAEKGEPSCFIPLGNRKKAAGRFEEAKELYERGMALGDINAAENLASLLVYLRARKRHGAGSRDR